MITLDINNKVKQLKEIQASTPLEKYEEIMSDLKSKEHLVEASKEIEVSISKVAIFTYLLVCFCFDTSFLNFVFSKLHNRWKKGSTNVNFHTS